MTCGSYSNELSACTASAPATAHLEQSLQLEAEVEEIERDKSDLRDALTGEKEARVAAVEELEARLKAKEKAEEEKEEAESQFRELKQRYIERAESLAKAQDDANAEVWCMRLVISGHGMNHCCSCAAQITGPLSSLLNTKRCNVCSSSRRVHGRSSTVAGNVASILLHRSTWGLLWAASRTCYVVLLHSNNSHMPLVPQQRSHRC